MVQQVLLDQQGQQVILEALVRLERRGLLDKQGQLVLQEAREQQVQARQTMALCRDGCGSPCDWNPALDHDTDATAGIDSY